MTAKNDTTPPDRVTRFYGNTDYALETIACGQITFVQGSMLNDPFDPYFFFETNCSHQSILDYISKYHHAELPWFENHLPVESWSRMMTELEQYLNSLRAGTFVFSTSGQQDSSHPKDNLYMWGHYGNGHRGIAIEFDTNELRKAVEQPTMTYDDVWVKMTYGDRFPPITCEHFVEFFIQNKEPDDGDIQVNNTKL